MVDITVVIPTLADDEVDIPTLESVPDGVPVNLQRESPISRARNRGVERADTEYVIQLDDDIQFDPELWDEVTARLDQGTVVGMADWDFGLVVTRLIAFPKSAWETVGGFDDRLGSHMEDTDFAIKLEKAGYELVSVPQGRIKHVPHETRISMFDRVWRTAYLCIKHPKYARRLVGGVLQ